MRLVYSEGIEERVREMQEEVRRQQASRKAYLDARRPRPVGKAGKVIVVLFGCVFALVLLFIVWFVVDVFVSPAIGSLDLTPTKVLVLVGIWLAYEVRGIRNDRRRA